MPGTIPNLNPPRHWGFTPAVVALALTLVVPMGGGVLTGLILLNRTADRLDALERDIAKRRAMTDVKFDEAARTAELARANSARIEGAERALRETSERISRGFDVRRDAEDKINTSIANLDGNVKVLAAGVQQITKQLERWEARADQSDRPYSPSPRNGSTPQRSN